MEENELREKTMRGGLAKVCSQIASFVLRLGSLMILGRLLSPKDFGLVGMVTAVIGVLNLFKDFGLSTATIQRATVTEEQTSTLFWINILIGGVLGVLSVVMAPVISVFYHEPRLAAVTAVMAAGFLFNAAGVQHSALLQREMRFTTSSIIDVVSLTLSIAIGVGMALTGYGYWALVGMAVSAPIVATVGYWLSTGWIPGLPRKEAGIRSMLQFGGAITLNGLVVYIAYNLEKVLLGRFWGAEVVGIYGRAYQLINIPTDNLNSAAGGVAFAALSRVQNDPQRLRSYFLKGYSLIVVLTLPLTIGCALFADDLILVLLGPKWNGAARIFQLLSPTILIFALINPMAWLLFSIGKVGRSLKVALVLSPLVISGYLIGLPYGPTGVALAYSSVMALWALPHIAWCVHGTAVSLRDVMGAISRPLVSGLVAAALPYALQYYYGHLFTPLLRLVAAETMFLGIYAIMLLGAMGQRDLYWDLLRGLRRQPPAAEKAMASA